MRVITPPSLLLGFFVIFQREWCTEVANRVLKTAFVGSNRLCLIILETQTSLFILSAVNALALLLTCNRMGC